ncbi:GNAT family N-acetyltransferase [Methylibium sp.]|uniref:GNAT family N-acetyltransferase n=1 Tax=Methylibium sp. TaxID=2067992 RepID=UPI0025E398BA|nr:GNAT family N-acetyltransferase [Methylibium sp.]
MIVHAPPAVARLPAAGLSPAFDARLLARIEDAGLNASAPPQQRVLGGWILRLSPGKAKRARCVNALAVGRLPLPELLARAEAVFELASLPFIVRITPFTQPATLDALLQARGFKAFDDTRVMVRVGLDGLGPATLPAGCELEAPGHGAFAEAVGALRGTPLAQRQAHAQRLRESPSAYSGLLLKRGGSLLACGQLAMEDDLVGLYDVFTVPEQRQNGLATALCLQLLRLAHERGARCAYLQLDADNHAARSVYARLGFVDAYAYHYRSQDTDELG